MLKIVEERGAEEDEDDVYNAGSDGCKDEGENRCLSE